MSDPKYPLDLRPQDEEMYRRGWNDAHAEVERLVQEHRDGQEIISQQASQLFQSHAQLTEAAAILDRVAEHLDKWLINEQFSADCRAKAAELRMSHTTGGDDAVQRVQSQASPLSHRREY